MFRAGNKDSDPRTLRFGVPQGSVAGPQTLVCYTEDLLFMRDVFLTKMLNRQALA